MEDKVDPRWRKSSYSGNGGSDCVEVNGRSDRVLVRDTKNRTGPVLEITPGAWRRFANQVKRSLARGQLVLAGDTLTLGMPCWRTSAPHGACRAHVNPRAVPPQLGVAVQLACRPGSDAAAP